MTKTHLLLVAIIGLFIGCNTPEKGNSSEKVDLSEGRTLVWSEEFEIDGLPDSTKWSYDLGDGCPNICGWGNQEEQYYTDNAKNARVENGQLIIEAHQESIETREYTSARLTTKGKGDWKYGLIEVRAKLQRGVGSWSAIWMLPTEKAYGGWPRSGEIDIMEHVGYNADSIYGTVHTQTYNHTKGTQKGGALLVEDGEAAFHVYGINWTEEKIQFYVDDEIYFTFKNDKATSDEWPFDQPFHLILNTAIGGSWGGSRGIDKESFPQKMEIDYIRVYE